LFSGRALRRWTFRLGPVARSLPLQRLGPGPSGGRRRGVRRAEVAIRAADFADRAGRGSGALGILDVPAQDAFALRTIHDMQDGFTAAVRGGICLPRLVCRQRRHTAGSARGSKRGVWAKLHRAVLIRLARPGRFDWSSAIWTRRASGPKGASLADPN